jgi:FKBP-type peptidyl-prolyl cis-trans isomerase 2
LLAPSVYECGGASAGRVFAIIRFLILNYFKIQGVPAMDRITKLSETIRTLMEGEFSGYIKINFSQGSLGRVEKSEEFADAAILLMGKNDGKKESGEANFRNETLKSAPLVLLLSLALAGCATSGTVKPAQPAAASVPGNVRTVRAGDVVNVRYLCRLKSGEVAAATDPVAESLPKSNIYQQREGAGPVLVAASGDASDAAQAQAAPFEQRSLEEEILRQLAPAIAGMREGETRAAELKAEDAPPQEAHKYIARLTRVRTRPKEWKMPKGDYEFRAGRSSEVGQEFTYDPDFPGKVVSVTDREVVVRLFATPGAVIDTPFGPGRVREEGDDYRLDIDAHKGALIRAAGMTGRISDVDDKAIIIDFGNAFGGETLLCDVAVEKIIDEKLAQSGERR